MTETYFDLAAADRQEVLEIAASASGRPVHLLEKDIWVVWCLETLFGSDIGAPLVFKGGTSLSKAYQVIKRFSDDVDLTYDIRELAPDLVADAPDTLPSSRSQESRWSKEARKRLVRWVSDADAPFLAEALARVEPSGDIRVEDDEIFIRYAARTPTSDYVRPEVKLEFGARATGEPNQRMPVVCDAAPYVAGVLFPAANPRVMTAERTFWEKATAAHVYCKQGRLRGERFARHWYDLVRLAEAGYANTAIRDRHSCECGCLTKGDVFSRKGPRRPIYRLPCRYLRKAQYRPPRRGARRTCGGLFPKVDDGLLIESATPFDDLMKACSALEAASKRSVYE
ncbi:nucleotidyl transferase AbiEii/AbiGii toxin family protein [Salipiger pacificus]|nr:nucleotidyl transferase AbiEii/AbiGii toxin family protein [Alloyangia pacifica]MCA0948432.1 nucleotidyl transferase AbiEii/AbiGii toxin family protein [Alloyangia pacifica]